MLKKTGMLVSMFILMMSVSLINAQGQEVSGQAEVEFKANQQVIPPVDPGDGENITPIHPPTKGPLSINYATNINFGKNKRGSLEQIFYAEAETVTNISTNEEKKYPAFVQVTDLRGSAAGWTLSVKQNGPLVNEKNDKLTGAELCLSAVRVAPQYEMSHPPKELIKNISLTETGDVVPVVKAEAGTGMGTWNIYLGDLENVSENITLRIPKNSKQETGRYRTSLSWFLQDVL